MGEPMTNQEIFNTVWNGLASQEFERSVDKYGGCQYRGDHGRKCAAGWLIPDDAYSIDLEGLGSCSPELVRLFNSLGLGASQNLIFQLQLAHDEGKDPATIKIRLLSIATDFKLLVPSQPSLPL